jgi:hypothetical protein
VAAHQRAFQGPNGALTRRDVKNEDRSGYVHENTEIDDKMSADGAAFLQENAPME